MARKSYEKRLENCKNPLVAKLFKIIIEKQTNLCLSADLDSIDTILRLVDKVGKHICMLKVHSDLINGDVKNNYKLLAAKKKEHNFLLFEDRKFLDHDGIVKNIFARYVQYVDLVTVYNCFAGVEAAVKEANLPSDEPRGALSVCQASFIKSGFPNNEASKLLKSAEESEICAGIIAQNLQLTDDNNMFKATPGVHLALDSDGGNQYWLHPSAVIEKGADVIIVGRGITSAPEEECEKEALLYKESAWNSYLKDIK